MIPLWEGEYQGQSVCNGETAGYWEWQLDQDAEQRYEVVKDYITVAKGLTREQGAKLAGLLLLDPQVMGVSLKAMGSPGKWVFVEIAAEAGQETV